VWALLGAAPAVNCEFEVFIDYGAGAGWVFWKWLGDKFVWTRLTDTVVATTAKTRFKFTNWFGGGNAYFASYVDVLSFEQVV